MTQQGVSVSSFGEVRISVKNVFDYADRELISTKELTDNDEFVIFEATVKTKWSVIKNLEIGWKDNIDDVVLIQTIATKIIS